VHILLATVLVLVAPASFSPLISNLQTDIFDKSIIQSVSMMSMSPQPPPCFHENVTTITRPMSSTSGSSCRQENRDLFCFGNYYEVIYGSQSLPNIVFLRKTNSVSSQRCFKESTKCNICQTNNFVELTCRTSFDRSRTFVKLDDTLTKVEIKFEPRVGLYCRCREWTHPLQNTYNLMANFFCVEKV